MATMTMKIKMAMMMDQVTMRTYKGETYIADDSVQFLFRECFINLFQNDLQKACQERSVGALFKPLLLNYKMKISYD